MLRAAIFVATVLAAGCPSKRPPDSPRPVAPVDAALRIRIAQAEAKRAAGVDELVGLATSADVHARELALRGLARIGGAKAIATIEGAIADRDPRVVAAALDAIGILAALHEPADWKPDVTPHLGSSDAAVKRAAAEAAGRAGDASAQGALAACRDEPACVLALARHGRRKLKLSAEARTALVKATTSPSAELRYAATYALAREHEPADDAAVISALAARITDEPEIGAQAIAGLAKRKATSGAGRTSIEAALRTADWRVAVEAVRALANADDAGRATVAAALPSRYAELVKGNAGEAHVILEALRNKVALTFPLDPKVDALTNGWIECLATPTVVTLTSCKLPDHLRLPLLADLAKSTSDPAVKRAAMRSLLGHDDPRVRAAGLGALAATWKDADARTQQTIVTTLTAALASKNPIVAGSAIDAAGELYVDLGAHQAAIDSAIAARAKQETDVELSASLFAMIAKHEIAAGADACRAGTSGHRVRAKAAADCLKELGEQIATVDIAAAEPPPGDITEVIGRQVMWTLTTTRGAITIELRPDVAPWAVASIVALTRRGFYDGKELHRVVPNFVAQGGDPTESGWGGPGYTLPAEPSGTLAGAGFVAGGVGVADAGPDSGGSQWFVMHSRAAHLDGRYTWIGSVVSGQKSADALLIGDRVDRATITIASPGLPGRAAAPKGGAEVDR